MSFKVKLVEDWKSSYKWLSMWAMGASSAFLAAWAVLPQYFQDALPKQWIAGIAVFLIVGGMGGRLVKQGTPNESQQ